MTWPLPSLRERRTWLGSLLMLVLGTAAGAVIFSFLVDPQTGSDLPLHVQLVIESRTEDTQLGYTIYYSLLELVSGGGNAQALRRATIIVLALSYGLRLAVTWVLLSLTDLGVSARLIATLAAAIAAPVTIVPWNYLHVGMVVPVVWHNSTVILAAPFALLLFASTCWVMSRRESGWAAQVVQVALVVASGWTKPNYILALVPALALICLFSAWSAPSGSRATVLKDLWWRAGPTGVTTAAVLLVQYVRTYGGPGLLIEGQRVSNVVTPFGVWKEWSTTFDVPVLPLLFLSVIPPAMLSALVWGVRRCRYPLVLAWTSLLVGLVQFVMLAEVLEDGTVLFHGNWIWGAQLSMAVLFLVSFAAFLTEFKKLSWARWIPAAIVTYQVTMGVVWLALLFSGFYTRP